PRRPRAVLAGAALARRRRRMTARLAELSVAEVRVVLAGREATAVEITEACLEALAARNPRVRAFLTVTADDALAAARTADAALARGDAGPLAGVPIGVKDLLAVRGVARTNGSAAFVGDPPGLKPADGRVTRAGVTPLAWTLDRVGPLARSAEDAALLLGVLAGHDPADPTSARVPVPDYAGRLDRSLRGVRIGVPRDFA